MAISFKAWTHPTTGEQRVYLNGLCGQQGAKVFVYKKAEMFGDWSVAVSADWMMNKNKLRDDAMDEVVEMLGNDVTFEQILAAA